MYPFRSRFFGVGGRRFSLTAPYGPPSFIPGARPPFNGNRAAVEICRFPDRVDFRPPDSICIDFLYVTGRGPADRALPFPSVTVLFRSVSQGGPFSPDRWRFPPVTISLFFCVVRGSSKEGDATSSPQMLTDAFSPVSRVKPSRACGLPSESPPPRNLLFQF